MPPPTTPTCTPSRPPPPVACCVHGVPTAWAWMCAVGSPALFCFGADLSRSYLHHHHHHHHPNHNPNHNHNHNHNHSFYFYFLPSRDHPAPSFYILLGRYIPPPSPRPEALRPAPRDSAQLATDPVEPTLQRQPRQQRRQQQQQWRQRGEGRVARRPEFQPKQSPS